MTNLPQHSPVGFSKRKQWSRCPGSIKLSEGMPSKSSKFADEGTAAHALQEYCLRNRHSPLNMVGVDFPYEDHGEDKSIVVTQEMAGHIDSVVQSIWAEMATDRGAVLLVEERFHLHTLHPDLFGTGDVVIWFPKTRKLQARDLKFGAGVAVDIEDEDGEANVQLEGYALGALLKYPEWKPTHVEMVIDQPRAFHADGATRRTTRPVSYFVDMAADLVDEVKRTELASEQYALIGDGLGQVRRSAWQDIFLKQGDHCRWCAAAPVCPLLKNKAQELAKQVFAPGAPYDAAELARTLEWLPILDAWSANVREFAYSEAEKGHAIPNHKLVLKRAIRRWRDDAGAIVWLTQQGLDPFGEAPLISPAAAEKKLGKEQRAFMAPLVVAESSGHALVHESDKREAVRVDAKAAFGGA